LNFTILFVKAREKLGSILKEIISERKEKKLLESERDLLSCLLNWKGEGGEILSDDEIGDNIIGVLFAAQDTTATVMTWVIKYLHDEPKLLECVKVRSRDKFEKFYFCFFFFFLRFLRWTTLIGGSL